MQVQRVQNNNNFNPAFKSVIIDKSAAKVVESLTEAEQKEFNNIVKRVSDTKFWDMRLSKVLRQDEFWCDFVNKKKPKKVYKLGVNPLGAEGSKVEIYPVMPQDNSKVEKITFSSPQRAKAMLDMHKRHKEEMFERNYKSTNLQRLTRWAQQLEFLDEAYRYMKLGEVRSADGTQSIIVKKPTITDKIKNFFQIG